MLMSIYWRHKILLTWLSILDAVPIIADLIGYILSIGKPNQLTLEVPTHNMSNIG